jgi:uncharacterized membrane protein YphA (DoxX/SURF4 family)
MLVRRIARPMFAAWFVSEGVEAVRSPAPHVARAEAAWRELGPRLSLGAVPSRPRLTGLVRAHGAATAVAGLMLATGRAPRFAALVLAGLAVPTAIVNQPFGGTARIVATAGEATTSADPARRSRLGRPIGATGGVATAEVTRGGADRAAARERFLRSLSMIGGAVIAGLDTEGRPGVAWRASHARVDRCEGGEGRSARGASRRLLSSA